MDEMYIRSKQRKDFVVLQAFQILFWLKIHLWMLLTYKSGGTEKITCLYTAKTTTELSDASSYAG